MGHSPYSPDLASNYFYLIPSAKDKLRGQRFQSREEAVDAFKMHVLEIPQSEWKKCYQNWFPHVQKLKMSNVATEPPKNPGGTIRIVKNAFMISLAFMFQFTAYNGAANLQSSINAEAGLGMASLAGVYVGLVVSNIFLPVMVINYALGPDRDSDIEPILKLESLLNIVVTNNQSAEIKNSFHSPASEVVSKNECHKWLGCKWSMSVAFLIYMPYIASQLWPKFSTLVPTALLLGLAGGPLWCAKCTYLTVASEAHNRISGIPAEVIVVRLFGMFYMIFQLSQVWGNLISSLVDPGNPKNVLQGSVELSNLSDCRVLAKVPYSPDFFWKRVPYNPANYV
ncbi:UNC93-like protein [Eumeta japonica]|uniref:UNC93-like protein n=1 Tax=Eumeta variegata TaxID=151549 RepID=A0A4C1Y6Z4_EUMVA|nr:UNC93-like protein [Eumeta japonica]